MQYALPANFNQELERVMNQEKGIQAAASLKDHLIWNYLASDQRELDPPLTVDGKAMRVVYPEDTPAPTLVSRVGVIGAFFNPQLPAEQWQRLCDHHPASVHIQDELQMALLFGMKIGTQEWDTRALDVLMNQLDKAGYLSSFNRRTMVFTIMFSGYQGVNVIDAQKDLRNRGLLEMVNGINEDGTAKGGWQGEAQTFTEHASHSWKIQLREPSLSEYQKIRWPGLKGLELVKR